ncbi:MAG: 16S rRNA (guanine(966)-N(2))-methyltransferase RsmD [Microbacterium sp.]
MTRIIAGLARGARLEVPSSGTRPTSDRVRESLFGALEAMDAVADARVLDLYAGSGALGLEALSRGATSADLVERGRQAAAIVRRNAALVAKASASTAEFATRSTEPIARVHESAVQTFLARASGPYDLVFTDPPYDIEDAAMNADLVALAPSLSPDAVVVVERAKRATTPDFAAAGLESFRQKTYGDTILWWAAPQPTTESQSR